MNRESKTPHKLSWLFHARSWIIPLLAVSSAVVLTWMLEPWVGERIPFGLFYLAISISAIYGGLFSALLAIVFSLPATLYFFMEPRFTFIIGDPAQLSALILFAIVTAPTSFMGYWIKRSRDRLSDSLHALRQQAVLLENSSDALVVRTLGGTIRWWSRRAENLYGWSSEEAVGRVLHELLQSKLPEELSKITARIERGEEWRGEIRQRTKTGRDIVVSSFWHPEISDGAVEILESNMEITTQVEAQRDQARLSAIVESSNDAIISEDLDGVILSWNAAAERLFGRSAKGVLGKPLIDLLPPQRVAEERTMLERVRRGEEIASYDTIRLTAFGGDLELSITASPIRSSKGEVIGISRIASNITGRTQVERTLRESEARYRAILENMSEGLIICDAKGEVIYENPASIELLRFAFQSTGETRRMDQASLAPYWELSDLARRPLPYDEYPVARILRGEQLKGLVVRVRNLKMGVDVVTSCNGGTILDEDGTLQFAFFTMRDITEERRITEELESREQKFRGVVESNIVGTFFWNVDGRITSANNRLLEMIGYTREDLAKGLVNWQELTPPEYSAADIAAVHEVRAVGELHSPYEKEYIRKDGTRVPIIITAAMLDADRRDGVAFVVDITDRKRLEAQLRDALKNAEAANVAKDEFLAVLSHELRTPLTPVFAAIAMIKRQDEMPAKSKEWLELIQRNVAMEARLIDDLLDLTRIVRGKISLHKERIGVADVLSRVAEVCRPDIQAKGIHFGITLREPSLPVFGDPARLQQVFWNLVNNSIKFTPHGGTIEVQACVEGSNVVVSVRDTGIGIESTLLPKVFEAFEQGGAGVTRQFGGLGIGLAIAKRLIEMHNGGVTVESEGKGKGATFRVSLPLERHAALDQRNESAEAHAAAVPREILLVEDHKDTSDLLTALLESLGHKVKVAGTIADALQAASAHSYDLLISDIGLPDRSGVDLMRELRRSGSTIKGIALSGYGREEDIQRCREAGFAEHLTKPVDIDLLEQAVARLGAGIGVQGQGQSGGASRYH